MHWFLGSVLIVLFVSLPYGYSQPTARAEQEDAVVSPAPDVSAIATAVPTETLAAAASSDPELAQTACSLEFRDFVATADLGDVRFDPCPDQTAVAAARAAGPCIVECGYKYRVDSSSVGWTMEKTPECWFCCELCRAISECNSWWMRKSGGTCYLNRIQASRMRQPNACGNNI